MTLHEAIELALKENKSALSAIELANIINDQGLYFRKDNRPVTPSQVMARVNNYDSLFLKKGNKIALRYFDELEEFEKEIQEKLLLFYDIIRQKYRTEPTQILQLILFSLIRSDKMLVKANQGMSFDHLLKAIDYKFDFKEFLGSRLSLKGIDKVTFEILDSLVTLVQRFPDRHRIVQKLIYWIYKGDLRDKEFILPEYIGRILGKLNIFGANTNLYTTQNMLNNFTLSIYQENKAINKNKYFELWRNDQIAILNDLLLESCNVQFLNQNIASPNNISIITPPWNIRREKEKWSSNFIFLKDHYESDVSEFNKSILIVPEGALFNKGKDLAARKFITNNSDLEAIINIPFKSSFTSIKSVALIFLDFNKRNNEVFMADFTLNENFDIINNWSFISEIYNQRNIVKDLSSIILLDDIKKGDYDWAPKRYASTFEIDDIAKIKPNHELIPLRDLLLSSKRGRKVNRKSLYEGGEIKYIRIKDLDSDNYFLSTGRDTLGIDFDQLEQELIPTKNLIIASLIGKKIKIALVPDSTSYLFDPNLALIEVDTTKVLPQFLANELLQDYVQKQFTYLIKGATIPYLSIKDLVKIQIQIPSLEIQKDLLIERNRQAHEIPSMVDHFLPKSENTKEYSQSILHNYLGIIKHTMKQPLATLSEDISNIKDYLNRKSDEGVLMLNEFIVPLLPGELENENEESRIEKVLDRLERAVKDAHWRFEQSENLLKIETSKVQLKKVNIREYLISQMSNYPDIKSRVKGESTYLLLDKNLFSILIDNLVDNARKHGFKESLEKKILFVLQRKISSEGIVELVINYFNNGLPLEDDFDINKFIINRDSIDRKVSEGFGGYLINAILKKHDGEIEIIKDVKGEPGYNVHFRIILKGI